MGLNLARISEITAAKIHWGGFKEDLSISISGLKNLDSATEDDLSFYFPSSKRAAADNLKQAYASKAKALFVSEVLNDIEKIQLVVTHPMAAMVRLAEIMRFQPSFGDGIHPTAVIDQTAKIEAGVKIGPYCIIAKNCVIAKDCILHANIVLYENVELGEKCEIHAGVVIRENVVLGQDCLIQAGAVIGGEGFGYIPDRTLGHRRIPHMGAVRLADRVDLGANASVDRGTLGDTVIGESSKLDSLVQVGHNNQLGKRVLVCAMSGIGGSGSIGDDSVVGGHVGIADHVKIGSKVRLGGKTGVSSNVPEPGDYIGSFYAEPAKQYWRQLASIKSLPILIRDFREWKTKLINLEKVVLNHSNKKDHSDKKDHSNKKDSGE